MPRHGVLIHPDPLPEDELLELAFWFHLRYGRDAPLALPPELDRIYHETVVDADLI